MTKTLESEVSAMCNLSKGVEERGIARGLEQGLEQGTLNAIQNLMESLKMTAGQAMEALKIPEADKVKYTGMLNK
jgi:predicted transposase YdaD